MDAVVVEGFDYLGVHGGAGLLTMFWYLAVFEVPRYGLAFLVAAFLGNRQDGAESPPLVIRRISVVIAGHNEAKKVERCVRALHEQSRPPDEIILASDGSTDLMSAKARDLQQRGLVQSAHCTDLRGGKSAALNLAARCSTGEIVVIVDCDCSFDRHALRNALVPFADGEVGAVAGNVLVRNVGASLVSTLQAIEYLISISLGRQAADMFGQVSCISGAFGAFRRSALDSVAGHDAGGGEDLDVTLRLRRAGWRIRFAADAICYTDVPETPGRLVRQRFRWERDAVHLRYRKHLDLMNPLSPRFHALELLHEIEFLLFNVVSAAMLPVYLIWLFVTFGEFGLVVLVAAQSGLMLLDFATFLLAAHATPRTSCLGLLPFVPGYSVINGFVMRLTRLAAYLQEWVFDASYRDEYVPDKVHLARF